MGSEVDDEPFLPFELITLILLNLPIKSIVRFQCVCKAWKNLFKTQSFISQHNTILHSAHQNPFLLIHAYDYNHHRSTLRLLDHDIETTQVLNTHLIDSFTRPWRILGSTKGLICVELQTQGGTFPFSYLLWDPLSNKITQVPHVLDDCGNASKLGFGYSSVANDYKIVRFYDPHLFGASQANIFGSKKLTCVQVYSLSTGLWRELEMLQGVIFVEIYSEAATVNGSIFWKGHAVSLENWLSFDMIVAFDIATEVFTVTPMHDLVVNMGADEIFFCPAKPVEYGNKLAMCEAINYIPDESYNMYLWLIEEGASESGKTYTCAERHTFRQILRNLRPLCIWRDEIVCRYDARRFVVGQPELEVEEKNYLYLFNLITKEWKKFPNFSRDYQRCDIFNYEESLGACLRLIG